MKLNIGMYLLLLITIFAGCGEVKEVSKTELKVIAAKPPESWTITECNAILKNNTFHNTDGYYEKLRANREFSYENVYITAMPLNFAVINAIVRKEAIQRRFTPDRYKQRLKEYFKDYTRYTVDSVSGKVLYDMEKAGTLWNEISFIVKFENISVPYHPIEVNMAEEGFFLENLQGEFSRVIKSYSYYDSENLVISGETELILTFSLYKDDGTLLNIGPPDNEKYRLVFNGLQDESIIVSAQ